MAIHHFMLRDLLGALRTIAVFPLFGVAPGYMAAWLLDLFDFRCRTLLFRLVFAVPLSISICPILTHLTGRFASMTAVWVLCFHGVRLCRPLGARPPLGGASRQQRRSGVCACDLACVCLFSTIDLQIGDRGVSPKLRHV